MKRIVIASLFSATLFVLPFASLPAGAIDKADEVCKQGLVSVSYTAEKEVSPDTVQISIAVKTSDKYFKFFHFSPKFRLIILLKYYPQARRNILLRLRCLHLFQIL